MADEEVPLDAETYMMTGDYIERQLRALEGFEVAIEVFLRCVDQVSKSIPMDRDRVFEEAVEILLAIERQLREQGPEGS